MLVLSRCKGETICIGDDITVTVTEIRAHQVKLGIEAPLQVQVHRAEVYQAVQREKSADDRETKRLIDDAIGETP